LSIKKKIDELRKVARLHSAWLQYALLGEDSISKEQLKELKSYGKLPMDKPLDVVKQSYMLGRLKAVKKKGEFADLSYQELEDEIKKSKLTPLEKLVVEQAQLHAGSHMKHVADDIANGAFDALAASLGEAVTEATVRQIVADETALALLENKSAKKLASSIASSLKSDWSRDWNKVAKTELQAAKTMGSVQAIVNKVDIYAGGDGVDSYVSVIPRAGACKDCAHHYMDGDTPKVFRLRELLDAGSNADSNVKHTRGSDGRHEHWKSTLSPLHPECSCAVMFVPPGMGWQGKKMIVKDTTALQKGISSGISGNAATAPGFAGLGTKSTSPLAGVEKEYRSDTGTKPEGSGWQKTKKRDGSQGTSWVRPAGMSDGPTLTKEDEAKLVAHAVEQATTWGKHRRSIEEEAKHLETSDITTKKDLQESQDEASGAHKALRCTHKDNGRSIAKPSVQRGSTPSERAQIEDGIAFGPGLGGVPWGTEPQREKAAFSLSNFLGIGGVPTTITRKFEGEQHSFQKWIENAATFSHADLAKDSEDSLKSLLNNASPEHRDSFENQLRNIAILDCIMNNNDRHVNNLLFKKNEVKSESGETSTRMEVTPMDHGHAFADGLSGHRNACLDMFAKDKKPVIIPKEMKDKLDNTSYGDYKRAMSGSGVEEWAIAQTFLRSRYVSKLQETEGHLDPQKFRHTTTNSLGEHFPGSGSWKEPTKAPEGIDKDDWATKHINEIGETGNRGMLLAFQVKRNKLSVGGVQEFLRREDAGELPHQLFESSSKKMLEEAVNDPGHKDHEAAKEILEMGPFMGKDFARDQNKHLSKRRNKAHTLSVVGKDPPKQIGNNKPLVEKE
jgi:hypothetical protein